MDFKDQVGGKPWMLASDFNSVKDLKVMEEKVMFMGQI
jgi:hypothetical protein